jgi:hypothetical protein
MLVTYTLPSVPGSSAAFGMRSLAQGSASSAPSSGRQCNARREPAARSRPSTQRCNHRAGQIRSCPASESCLTKSNTSPSRNSRIAHRVHQRLARLGPDGLKLPSIPHNLVHQLREADGMAGGTGACGLEAAGARVRNMALVVGGVDVPSVPAAVSPVSVCSRPRGREMTNVGKVIVVRMPPGQNLVGNAAVSSPVQGAPPKGLCSMLCSQRWQICFCIAR